MQSKYKVKNSDFRLFDLSQEQVVKWYALSEKQRDYYYEEEKRKYKKKIYEQNVLQTGEVSPTGDRIVLYRTIMNI